MTHRPRRTAVAAARRVSIRNTRTGSWLAGPPRPSLELKITRHRRSLPITGPPVRRRRTGRLGRIIIGIPLQEMKRPAHHALRAARTGAGSLPEPQSVDRTKGAAQFARRLLLVSDDGGAVAESVAVLLEVDGGDAHLTAVLLLSVGHRRHPCQRSRRAHAEGPDLRRAGCQLIDEVPVAGDGHVGE